MTLAYLLPLLLLAWVWLRRRPFVPRIEIGEYPKSLKPISLPLHRKSEGGWV